MPPQARLPSAHALRGIDRALQDRSLIEQLKKLSDESEFFDHNSPSVRERREKTRANFEYIVSTEYNVTDVSEIWNSTTILERSKLYIGLIPSFAKGRFGNITASPLWHAKYALQWWAARLVSNFATMFSKWDAEIIAHIHLICIQFDLQTRKYEKHNLTDSELSLFYDTILKSDTDVDNAKQHFVAWLLAYFTAVRPGSITVCKGYEKGASLGLQDDRKTRPDDETLRWSDLEWVRYPHGIGVNVKFRYLKNARNAYSQKVVMACREFSLVPTLGNRIELDPSAHLFALAYCRGLFTQDLDTLFSRDEQFITRLDPRVLQLPVLLACGQDGVLLDSPMREPALNSYLQAFCLELGLYNRNTMYGFRRDALSDMRLREGTEQARRLAGHAPNSEAIDAYTERMMTDFDITAFRLQEIGLDAEEMKRMWRQTTTAKYQPSASGQNLKTVLHDRVEAKVVARQDWIQLDQAVKDVLSEVDYFLDLPPEHRYYGNRIIPEYQQMLISRDARELSAKLDAQLLHRKTRRKTIRIHVQREELQKIREEQKAELKMSSRVIEGNIANTISNTTSGADDPVTDIEEENSNDTDLLEDIANQGNLTEPKEWEILSESDPTAVQVDSGDTEQLRGISEVKQKIDARGMWIRMWVTKSSTSVKARVTRGETPCILCALDPTCTTMQKTLKRSRTDLDVHLKSSFHNRVAQVTRAIKAEPNGSVVCPVCGEEGLVRSTFLTHARVMHPTLMWECEDERESDKL